MPKFSLQSYTRLASCHPDLRRLFINVVDFYDCTILEGVRSHEQQVINVNKGVSKTLESKHLLEFSREPAEGVDAVDVAPYPLAWPKPPKGQEPAELRRWMKECARYYMFGGYVLAKAEIMGIKIVWGGDWNGNHEVDDQSFDDLVHFELKR